MWEISEWILSFKVLQSYELKNSMCQIGRWREATTYDTMCIALDECKKEVCIFSFSLFFTLLLWSMLWFCDFLENIWKLFLKLHYLIDLGFTNFAPRILWSGKVDRGALIQWGLHQMLAFVNIRCKLVISSLFDYCLRSQLSTSFLLKFWRPRLRMYFTWCRCKRQEVDKIDWIRWWKGNFVGSSKKF